MVRSSKKKVIPILVLIQFTEFPERENRLLFALAAFFVISVLIVQLGDRPLICNLPHPRNLIHCPSCLMFGVFHLLLCLIGLLLRLQWTSSITKKKTELQAEGMLLLDARLMAYTMDSSTN